MKHLFFPFAIFGLLLGCQPSDSNDAVDPNAPTDPTVVTATPRGEWTAALTGGGFNNVESYRNFQYSFEVATPNQLVAITLTSPDINVAYTLFNPLGELIESSGPGRSVTKPYTLNPGKYRLVIAADRGAIGKFDLGVTGTKDGLSRLAFQSLSSNTQNWGALGGGGKDVTYKNHFYSIDVTDDNFSLDVELESPDTEVALYVYNELGQALNTSYFGDRSRYVLLKLNKGAYTIMAATASRGSVGSYILRVVGKVQNLQRVESQVTSLKGTWANNTAFDTYSLELTPNTSPLDIALSSSETDAQIDLQDNNGTRVTYTVLANKSNYLLGKSLSKATYRIKVYPARVSGKAGSYTLDVFGRFTNFKKL